MPTAERRGFDSIVQAASGIAALEAGADGTPGALPCQLLDHGAGYLTAAAVLDALAEQRDSGSTHLARFSLARTAHWLLNGVRQPWDEPSAAFVGPVPADATLAEVPPPGSLAGVPLAWRRAARYGADDSAWSLRSA